MLKNKGGQTKYLLSSSLNLHKLCFCLRCCISMCDCTRFNKLLHHFPIFPKNIKRWGVAQDVLQYSAVEDTHTGAHMHKKGPFIARGHWDQKSYDFLSTLVVSCEPEFWITFNSDVLTSPAVCYTTPKMVKPRSCANAFHCGDTFCIDSGLP